MIIPSGKQERSLKEAIRKQAGVDFSACLHCSSCSNGCPFVEGMDFPPNAVFRMIQFGMVSKVLECSTIWVCVGCNTCSSVCPMAIDIPGVFDGLRHLALERGVVVKEPDILNFHNEVLNTVKRYGRTHKLEIMMRYKLKSMDLLSDIGMGLKMLQKRKLDLKPSMIKDKKALEKIFKK